MSEDWNYGSGTGCDCSSFWKVSKFTLKSVFSNCQNDPAVIYKVEGSGFPSGTVIAENLSRKTSFVYRVEKSDGTVESLLVAPGSEAALSVTSIARVSAYSIKGLLAGGRFHFDLMQPVET